MGVLEISTRTTGTLPGPIGGPDAEATVTLVIDGKVEWTQTDWYKQTSTAFQALQRGDIRVKTAPAGDGFTWHAGNESHEVWFVGPSLVLSKESDPSRPRDTARELERRVVSGEQLFAEERNTALLEWARDHLDDELALELAEACIRGKRQPQDASPAVTQHQRAAQRLVEHFNQLVRQARPPASLEDWDALTRGLPGREWETLPQTVFASWPDGGVVEGVVEVVNRSDAGVLLRVPIAKDGFAAIEMGAWSDFAMLVRARGADPEVCRTVGYPCIVKLVPASRKVEVLVVDGNTPIANAEVTMLHDRAFELGKLLPPIPMKRTEGDGVARFQEVPPSGFIVRIRGPGDERHEERLSALPPGTAGGAHRIKFDLSKLTSVEVTLVRAGGQPVARREFVVSPVGEESEFRKTRVVTDAKGRFVFRGLVNPNATLSVSRPDGSTVGWVSRSAPKLVTGER